MITIDGSTLEGGGQLTRLALCLSAITGTGVRIHSIRAGRSNNRRSKPTSQRDTNTKSGRGTSKNKNSSRSEQSHGGSGGSTAAGLKDSHLAALTFLAKYTNAKVTGDEVGSTEVTFRPSHTPSHRGVLQQSFSQQHFTISLSKPGSVWLIFQAILPFLLFTTDWSTLSADSNTDLIITLKGGTNVSKAMSTEYTTQVLLPILSRIGCPPIKIETISRGWAGNAQCIGEVKIRIAKPDIPSLNPITGRFVLNAFTLPDPGTLTKIDVSIIAEPESTRQFLRESLIALLGVTFPNIPVEIVVDDPSHDSRRMYILLVACSSTQTRFGVDYLDGGAKVKSQSEFRRRVGDACAGLVGRLNREVARGGSVDSHCQDQIVVFQALARGVSVVCGGGLRGRADRDVVVDEDGNEVDEGKVESVGDESGTLHTRTVRWVCEMVLAEEAVKFEAGGVCSGVGWNSGKGEKDKVIGLEEGMSGLNVGDSEDDV